MLYYLLTQLGVTLKMNKFFTSTIALLIIFVAVLSGCGKEEKKSEKEVRREEIRATVADTEGILVDFRPIQGRKLGGLYADIVGVEGVVPATLHINFHEVLASLWLRKLDREHVSASTVEHAVRPVELYKKDPRKMNLRGFVKQADQQVSLVKNRLDHQGACTGYKLNPSECKLWKSLAKDVRGLDLIAYGMTEIMPTKEGEMNVKVLDILLRHAGSNYMFTIPAMHDNLLSLGFYQFTSHAIIDDGKALGGVSRMNRYLSRDFKIPGSVIELYNGEHHRAAYLFALHNFAILAKQTSEKEFSALSMAIKRKPGDIVTFMAVAHHAPTLALKCMKSWLSKGAKGDLNIHLTGRLREYGKKSDNNLAALEKALL